MKKKIDLSMTVHAGPIERRDPVIDTIGLDIDNLLWHAGVDGHFDPFTLALLDVESAEPLPVQWQD